MVVSFNRGTPIWTPKCYGPYYWDSQKGTLIRGKPHIFSHELSPLALSLLCKKVLHSV